MIQAKLNQLGLNDPIPVQLLNFFKEFRVKKAISVFTEVEALKFADETVWLGPDFMDKYEEPSIHRFPDLTKCKL